MNIERLTLNIHVMLGPMIDRHAERAHVDRLQRRFPVVALLGPRQVGKTTLARQLAASWRGPSRALDLESAEDLALLADPLLTLRPLAGLIVFDKVQRLPEIFATRSAHVIFTIILPTLPPLSRLRNAAGA